MATTHRWHWSNWSIVRKSQKRLPPKLPANKQRRCREQKPGLPGFFLARSCQAFTCSEGLFGRLETLLFTRFSRQFCLETAVDRAVFSRGLGLMLQLLCSAITAHALSCALQQRLECRPSVATFRNEINESRRGRRFSLQVMRTPSGVGSPLNIAREYAMARVIPLDGFSNSFVNASLRAAA